MPSALAGTSIFRHLCLYALRTEVVKKKKGPDEESQMLDAVGEMRPDATIGGIQAVVWLENEMVAAVTSNGFLRLLQFASPVPSHRGTDGRSLRHHPTAGPRCRAPGGSGQRV